MGIGGKENEELVQELKDMHASERIMCNPVMPGTRYLLDGQFRAPGSTINTKTDDANTGSLGGAKVRPSPKTSLPRALRAPCCPVSTALAPWA